MRMIQLHNRDGASLYVDADRLRLVEPGPAGSGARVVLTEDLVVVVSEEPEAVVRAAGPGRRP